MDDKELHDYIISTHAPTEGSDNATITNLNADYDFNPRSHRRERRQQR